MAKRAYAVPSGTVAVTFLAAGPSAGAAVGKLCVAAVKARSATCAGASPTREALTVPENPVWTVTFVEPAALSAWTVPGAENATGRTTSGLTTLRLPSTSSSHVSEPKANAPSGAVVRVNSTLNVADLPGRSTSQFGVT